MDILWEDADLLAVNKPAGLLVDSGGRGDDLVTRMGCFAFHRLDRETSGIVLLGRSRRYAREITALFEEKRIRKAYLAVVRGEWRESRVDLAIEDRPAVTTFRRLALGSFAGEAASLIEALPKTGRTHQIRIHAAHVGHPILGDAKYGVGDAPPAEVGDGASAPGHALHAHRLDFRHPASGETISVKSSPHEWLSAWLKDFEGVKL
jgi:23S rRNA pseudouridine955/2504/2580 synthase